MAPQHKKERLTNGHIYAIIICLTVVAVTLIGTLMGGH